MDPYLEHPEFFPDLHDALINELKVELQGRLPASYYAMTSRRVWVEYSERIIAPDVNVLRRPDGRTDADGGTAIAVPVSVQPVIVYVPNDETRETFLEVYTVQGERRLVTAIEVLSLSNKTPGAHGRDLYLLKQRDLVHSQVHMVELDLLRGGQHTTVVPRDRAVAAAGAFDYHVCVRRFDEPGRFWVYPIPLEQRLPSLAVPLLPGDAPVTIDLQMVFDRAYDGGPYRRINPYRAGVIEPPLAAERTEWVQRRLREQGMLPV
jgi:hypothetical protein